MQEDTPGKAGGLPGNAFDLVYDSMADKVLQRVYSVDSVLGEWIR